MANPEHVEIVKAGPAMLLSWRLQHPDEQLDLRDAKLAGVKLGPTVNFSTDQVNAAQAWMTSRYKIREPNGSAALLAGADCTGADLTGADLRSAYLIDAILANATLTGANLRDVDLTGADLTNATLKQATLHNTRIEQSKLVGAAGLYGRRRAAIVLEPGVEYMRDPMLGADSAIFKRGWWDCRWSRLRSIGTFRVTGVSYFAFIAIILYVTFAHWYNQSLEHLVRDVLQARITSSQPAVALNSLHDTPITETHTAIPHFVTSYVTHQSRQRLAKSLDLVVMIGKLPLPPKFGLQLIALGLLAVGATLYTACCPDLIKENTETHWTRNLGNALLEYRAAERAHLVARLACASTYGLGGSYTVYYLLNRGWRVLWILFSA